MPEVRLAQPPDAEAVALLLVEFRDWIGRSWPDEESFHSSAVRLLENPDTEFLLAGDPADGLCQLRYRYGVWHATEDCCIEDLFVRDRARRQGLGRALVAEALERARRRGCARVELDTNESNAHALALYRSLGFESASGELGERDLLMRVRL